LKFTVSKPKQYVPSADAETSTKLPDAPFYKVFITISNPDSLPAYNPTYLVEIATSGSTEVSGVLDGAIGDIPSANILPGRSVTWEEAYPVKPGTHLTLEFDDARSLYAGPIVIFDGEVTG
jgi:hypothetical protein